MSTFGPKARAIIYSLTAGSSVAMYRYSNEKAKREAAAPAPMQHDQMRCRQTVTLPFGGGAKSIEFEQSNSQSTVKMKT